MPLHYSIPAPIRNLGGLLVAHRTKVVEELFNAIAVSEPVRSQATGTGLPVNTGSPPRISGSMLISGGFAAATR